MKSFLPHSRTRLSRCLGVMLIPTSMLLLLGLQGKPKSEPLPETIQPPISRYAQPDVVGNGEFRPIVNVSADGTITTGRKRLFDPKARDDFRALSSWLEGVRKKMHLEKVPIEGGESRELVAEKLLIRADRAAPFRCHQKIMENCGRQGIEIWKVQFAVSPPPDAAELPKTGKTVAEGRLDAYLPFDCAAFGEEMPKRLEVMLCVVKEGRKVRREDGKPWTAGSDELWSYGSDRIIEYSIGPRKMRDLPVLGERLEALHERLEGIGVVIDARRGVTFGEVVQVLDLVRKAGGEEITYVGSYE